jgi:hypothetical protein
MRLGPKRSVPGSGTADTGVKTAATPSVIPNEVCSCPISAERLTVAVSPAMSVTNEPAKLDVKVPVYLVPSLQFVPDEPV